MTIAREEIFGPVASVIPFDEMDDALRLADDTSYGLAPVHCPQGLAGAQDRDDLD
jgi:acyl-CoA reductase-like NAD-dependent aldehyde dehydrogenase